jgi:hypothetical protein
MTALTPHEFTQRWSASTLSERASYQQHFLDLCEMLGVPKPSQLDGAAELYTFEKGQKR